MEDGIVMSVPRRLNTCCAGSNLMFLIVSVQFVDTDCFPKEFFEARSKVP